MTRQLAGSDIWDANVTKYGFQSKEGLICATVVVVTFIICATVWMVLK